MNDERKADVDRSISRRTMIRNAAAVGAAAWTAPVIIESVASPAAAASVAACSRVEFLLDPDSTGCGTFTLNPSPDNGSGCFDPSIWNNLPKYAGTVALTPSHPDGGPCLYTLEIDPSSGCVIDSRSTAREDNGNHCSQGTLADGCHTMYFSPNFLPDRFKILIACAGHVCAEGAPCPPTP